jgi:molybdopterin-guanine dinucleotide biosynthesis adapter protein
MKIFSIIGWSGSGKTTLITRLIEYFQARQRRVIAVKSTRADYDLQPEAKDTARFLKAGAREVYLVSQKELLRMTPLNSPADLLADLRSRLRSDDIVLMEGFCQPGIPVIEVEDTQQHKALKLAPEKLAAVVTPVINAYERPCFHPDDIAAISAFMEAYHEK